MRHNGDDSVGAHDHESYCYLPLATSPRNAAFHVWVLIAITTGASIAARMQP